MNDVFTETLYQESGGEYAVMSNEERQMEVQFPHTFPISFMSLTLTPIIKSLVDNTPPPKLAFSHPASAVKLGSSLRHQPSFISPGVKD